LFDERKNPPTEGEIPMTCPGCSERDERIEVEIRNKKEFERDWLNACDEINALRAEVDRLKSEKDAAVKEAVENERKRCVRVVKSSSYCPCADTMIERIRSGEEKP
jgi:hypothetical protein